MNFYQEYMLSDAWRDKREERLRIDGHKCRTCGCSASFYPLHVHHVTYERLGHEDVANDLITLCADCHHAITDVMRRRRYTSRDLDVEFEEVANTVAVRVEATYGMANTSVSVDIIGTAAHAQRPNGKPAQQVGEIDETDFIQARQDRR